MGLEVATTIAGLVATNPVGATDFASQGDDHLRMIKVVLQTDAARLSEANTFVAAQTAASFIPSSATIPANGLYKPATNTIGLASNTTLRWSVNANGNHVLAAPSSGTTLSVAGVSGGILAVFNGPAAASSFVAFQTGGSAIGYMGDRSGITVSSAGLGIRAETTLALASGGGTERILIGASGNVTISAPSSGTTLALSGTAGSAMQTWSDGTQVASCAPLTSAAGYRFGTVTNHALGLYTNDSARVSIAAAGNVTVNAPSSGIGLVVSMAALGTAGVQVTSSNGSSAIMRLTQTSQGDWQIYNPGSSTDLRFYDGTADRAKFTTGGGLQLGAPTGGDKGVGALNLSGAAYVNGEELGYRSLYERTFAANDNTAATDNGRCVRYTSTGHTFTLDTDLPTSGVVTIRNRGTGNLTIAASGTLSWCNGSGSVPTGSRTLAIGGVVTAVHMGSGNYDIWGVGLS